MKVIALVKMNDSLALVFDEKINFVYTKIDDNTIIGEYKGLYDCLFRQGDNGDAFAGRKFDIELSDGKIEHCHGQWWSGKNVSATLLIGECVYLSYSYTEYLVGCYVYTGGIIDKTVYEYLISEYQGKIYEYREYEEFIINPIREDNRNKYIREITDKFIQNGFRQLNNGAFESLDGLRIKPFDRNYCFFNPIDSIDDLEICENDKDRLKKVLWQNVKSIGLINEKTIVINTKSYSYNFKITRMSS